MFVCLAYEEDLVAIAAVECSEGVQEIFVSDVRMSLAVEFVDKAIEEVASHEIPEVVEVVVRHLGNALIYDVPPDMLTKVAATREPFHCIEEVVMVEREGYHIYYFVFVICRGRRLCYRGVRFLRSGCTVRNSCQRIGICGYIYL